MKKIALLLAIFVNQIEAAAKMLPKNHSNKTKLLFKSKSSPLVRIIEESKLSHRTQEMNGEGKYLPGIRRKSVVNAIK